jgi:peptide/nickel transport system permease protein
MSQQPEFVDEALPKRALGALRPKRTWVNHLSFFVRRKPLGAAGAVIAILLIFMAIFAPFIANHDPEKTNPKLRFSEPSSETYFGGDHLGRDVFSRIVYGARISLQVGILSSIVGCTIGMIVGVAGVHFGGYVDIAIQRLVDGMMAFPGLLLAIAIIAALGSSINNVIIAISITYIPSTARILRSQALAIKEQDYILAARAVGAGDWRIVLKHMIPNCFAVFIVIVTFHMGGAIIAEASLSFLGLGAPPNVPAWGGMLSNAADWIRVAWWMLIFPAAAIAIVVFAWNLLGDSLRDVLDPRLRGTGGT